VGRPPLTEEQVRAKVVTYCERYDVSPVPEGGLPPFPSGKRETRQHREWLTAYRAHQRLLARVAGGAPLAPSSDDPEVRCALCTRAVGSEEAVPFARAGRRGRPWRLHADCADLLRRAEGVGPDTVARLSELLWPRHGRAGS
jgi:hypothetical protein